MPRALFERLDLDGPGLALSPPLAGVFWHQLRHNLYRLVDPKATEVGPPLRTVCADVS